MQVKHRANVAVGKLFLVVSVAEESEERTVNAERRLDDVRQIALVLFLIEIRHIFAGRRLMARQVVVRSVGDAPEFAPAEREQELEVRRRL